MQCQCDSCGETWHIPTKKFDRRSGKIHKMLVCPFCKTKNFIPILQRYTDKREIFD